MMIFSHERLYRGAELMARLGDLAVTVCGAGALGANLVENCVRQGFARLHVIDRDRVEQRNLSTQPYGRRSIGRPKAQILSYDLYRALGVEIKYEVIELTADNVERLLARSDVVVDCFDNKPARTAVKEACLALRVPCLHVGLSAGYAEVIWNENYRVPAGTQEDLCDYPLARNTVLLAVIAATEELIRFARGLARRNLTITLEDLAVRPVEL